MSARELVEHAAHFAGGLLQLGRWLLALRLQGRKR